MTIEQLIKTESHKLHDKTYVFPDIPEKKLNGALLGIAPGVDPDYVIAIIDTTLFGSGKEGCLFTGDSLYLHALAEDKLTIPLAEIAETSYFTTESYKKNGKAETVHHLKLTLTDGKEMDLTKSLAYIKVEEMAKLLNQIIELGKSGQDFIKTSQTMPLSMMDAEIKKSYVKLLCNFAYSDDDLISPQEYAEIISLIVRIEFETKDRFELRQYMLSKQNFISNEELLNRFQMELSEDYYSIISKSLIKDILFMNSKTKSEQHWKDNYAILELSKKLQIEENQVDMIYEAIKNDEAILNMRKNDTQIEKSIKDVAAKAAAVGVPLAAIYLSGSVIGVSAAGITSGLATLGLGGMLGFSSMFTGIGVAVLLGIGTYKGLKKLTGISDLENNKQREAMLQAIIINAQKSLNILVEDVNEITKKLTEALYDGVVNADKIQKLARIIQMMSQGAQVTSDRIHYAETEIAITKIPEKLDISRLVELTITPTMQQYRNVVMSCYEESLSESESKSVFTLRSSLTLDELRNLETILNGIGYNKIADASIAALKSATKKIMNGVTGN
ncbi:hypothetical protein KCG48_12700 [Proteiniclasticum sp. BAD-10]|uniref:ENT domain-containing protein n=1 Tax=Proteiniclasticum sediminis TaxID=2804028 RepID=A0A941CQR5_9CLOT|nr:hypothetical protein [Proteiniclasticum sediminis]MBR0577175.1 hypothetical protein [Proteiniclasticum sediminis]